MVASDTVSASNGGRARTRATAPPGTPARARSAARAAGSSGAGEAEVARRRQPGQPSARQGHARAAQRGAVAHGEHAGDRGAAVRVRLGLQMAEADIDEAMRHAERARQADLRLEAEVQRHGIRRDASARPTGAPRPRAPSPSQRQHPRPPQHRHAGALQPRQHAEPLPRQVGRGARHAPDVAPVRPGRGTAPPPPPRAASRPPASISQASCRFSGPLPAITHAPPGGNALRPHQRLQRAGGHHAGQCPARDRHRPLHARRAPAPSGEAGT